MVIQIKNLRSIPLWRSEISKPESKKRSFAGLLFFVTPQAAKACDAVGPASNMTFSPVCILFRRLLLGLFTQDERILMRAASIMLIDFFVEIGRSMNNTICGCMRGVGDVKSSMVVNLSGAWLISVGMSYVLGIGAGWGPIGIWIAFALDENIRGLILLCRWRSGRRKVGAQKRLHAVSG